MNVLNIIENHDIDALQQYIDSGENLDAQNVDGKTILMISLIRNFIRGAELLINNGANVNIRNGYGLTVLEIAIQNRFVDIVSLLISKHAHILIKHISLAINTNQEQITRLLIANIDANIRDREGYTILMLAIRLWSNDIIEQLVSRSNINAQTPHGFTALMIAIFARRYDIVELLINRGADANVLDIYGNFALQQLVSSRHYNIATSLLMHGADINFRNRNGQTTLFSELQLRHNNDGVRFLVEHGADVNVQDNYGFTPLMFAKTHANVLLLLQHGARVNTRTRGGHTALSLNVHNTIRMRDNNLNVNFDIIRLLLENGADYRDIPHRDFVDIIEGCYPLEMEENVVIKNKNIDSDIIQYMCEVIYNFMNDVQKQIYCENGRIPRSLLYLLTGIVTEEQYRSIEPAIWQHYESVGRYTS